MHREEKGGVQFSRASNDGCIGSVESHVGERIWPAALDSHG